MGRSKKPCKNCARIASDDPNTFAKATISFAGLCPKCGRDWSHKHSHDEDDSDDYLPTLDLTAMPEVEGERGECIAALGAMLEAYAASVSVGSAATWQQAREVCHRARLLLEAEERQAPREAVAQDAKGVSG